MVVCEYIRARRPVKCCRTYVSKPEQAPEVGYCQTRVFRPESAIRRARRRGEMAIGVL